MRWIQFIRYVAAFGAVFAVLVPVSVQAQNSTPGGSGQITLSLVVLEHRGIIVDTDQNILEIYSNTDNDVKPGVFSLTYGGASKPLNAPLERDYAELMGQVRSNHDMIIKRAKVAVPANLLEPDASVLYSVTPVATRAHPDHAPYFIRLDSRKF